MSILLIAKTFERPEVAVDTTMPIVIPPATPAVPISTMPLAPSSAIPIAPILTGPSIFHSPHPLPYFFIMNSFLLPHGFSYRVSCSLSGLILTAPSRFKVGSSAATVPYLISEAIVFFTCFDQPEVNDLNLADFWDSGPPYVDFHGFKVPENYASYLEAVYSSCGDFMQGFHLGRSARKHFLKLLGSVMNDIEHNFVDTVSTDRIP